MSEARDARRPTWCPTTSKVRFRTHHSHAHGRLSIGAAVGRFDAATGALQYAWALGANSKMAPSAVVGLVRTKRFVVVASKTRMLFLLDASELNHVEHTVTMFGISIGARLECVARLGHSPSYRGFGGHYRGGHAARARGEAAAERGEEVCEQQPAGLLLAHRQRPTTGLCFARRPNRSFFHGRHGACVVGRGRDAAGGAGLPGAAARLGLRRRLVELLRQQQRAAARSLGRAARRRHSGGPRRRLGARKRGRGRRLARPPRALSPVAVTCLVALPGRPVLAVLLADGHASLLLAHAIVPLHLGGCAEAKLQLLPLDLKQFSRQPLTHLAFSTRGAKSRSRCSLRAAQRARPTSPRASAYYRSRDARYVRKV